MDLRAYEKCCLCPRRCGVNRLAGQVGRCGMPARLKLARAMPHFGEEPVLTGSRGSGAVFFSGCSLRCSFCQNAEISTGGFGAEIDAERLGAILLELQARGVHNLNFVTGTHYIPTITACLAEKPDLPVVWNSSGYESPEGLNCLSGKVDIYLPDMKYADSDLAADLSSAPDYFPVAAEAIKEMYRQVGPVAFGADGLLKRGLIIRHLVLPGHIENSLKVLDWIADTFTPGSVLVSLMSQYVPWGQAAKRPPFDRHVTEQEFDAVRSWMELDGLDYGFIQDPASADSEWIPDFSLQGVLPQGVSRETLPAEQQKNKGREDRT